MATSAASRSRKPSPSKNVSARSIAPSRDAMLSLRLICGATLSLAPLAALWVPQGRGAVMTAMLERELSALGAVARRYDARHRRIPKIAWPDVSEWRSISPPTSMRCCCEG